MNFVQFVLPAMSIAIPIYLIWRDNHAALLFWVSFASAIDIFNAPNLLTITPIRAVGLAVLPFVVKQASELLKYKPVKLLAILMAYLAVLALIHGYLFPWPDYTGQRTLRYTAQGRSLIYLGSYTLEVIVALYFALQLRTISNFRYIFYGVIAGGLSSALGMVLEKAFSFDFFYFFTRWDFRALSSRPRGFNYEPRGGGAATMIALVFLMFPQIKLPTWFRILSVVFVYYGFHLAASISAVFMLMGASLFLAIYFSKNADRFPKDWKTFKRVIITISCCAALMNVGLPSYSPTAKRPSWPGTQMGPSRPGTQIPQNAWEYVIKSKYEHYFSQGQWENKLEIFDSLAVRYFEKDPVTFIFGAGPGLIGLPVSTPDLRIDSVPHSGVILQLSNYGLVGFFLWLSMVCVIFIGIRENGVSEDPLKRAMFSAFFAIMLMYFLQAKAFYVFGFGSGLALFFVRSSRDIEGASKLRGKEPVILCQNALRIGISSNET